MPMIKYLVLGFLAITFAAIAVIMFSVQLESLYKAYTLMMIWGALSSFANYYITEKLKMYLYIGIVLIIGACVYYLYNILGNNLM
jgi:hypothetical protein